MSSAKSPQKSKTKNRGEFMGVGDIVKVLGQPFVGRVLQVTQRRALIERLDEPGIQEIYENNQLVILKRRIFTEIETE